MKNKTKKTKKNKILKVKTSKNKKRSIRKKINMKGGVMNIEIMETEPFNIPTQSYPLKKSQEDIIRYSTIMSENGIDENSIDIFKNLLDVTVHITFDNLIDSIKRTIDEFEGKIGTNPFYLFIPIIEDKPIKEKSNYWISKIFYLLMNKKPREIITSFEEITDEMKDIIVCDDAIYSGKQMIQIFRNFNRHLTHKHKFHILCPFISQLSMDSLNGMDQFNKTFYKDEIIKPFYEDDNFSASNLLGVTPKNYPIYFDHRVADNSSSFPYVYELGRVCSGGRRPCIYLNSLLQNCNHEGLVPISTHPFLKISDKFITKCPPIPYRPGIEGKYKDAIRLITPEEFIHIYKNREYRRVPILSRA
jgi:hypothetical protein